MQHQLDIIIDDSLSTTVFAVRDVSSYIPNIPVKTPVLEVTSPGGEYPVIFDTISAGFSQVINVTTLHLNANGIYPLPALPDGVYNLRYSISPNQRVYIAYNYFRNVRQLNTYTTLLTDIISNRRDYSFKQYEEIKRKLLWYKELIDGAKFLAEDRGDINAANEVYEEVNNLLNNFSC